jgi:hypothetical protein
MGKRCTHIKLGAFWLDIGARKFYGGFGYTFYDITCIKRAKRP